MSERKSGEKRQLTEEDEGMEVDQERKRAREGTSEEEASESLLGEEGSLVAQAAMGAEEEERLLNEEGEGTSTEQEEENQKDPLRSTHTRATGSKEGNGTSADVPAPATKPSSSAGQTKPDQAPLPTERPTTSASGKKSKSGKGKERKPVDLPCSSPSKILVTKKDGGACSKADFANIQQSFIKTRLAMGKEAGGSAQPVRIRDSRLVNGRVEVTVWDKPSEQFVMRAVGGLEVFSTGAGVGTATFFFNLPSYWHY
ncbi:hypothetical protein ACHWQZ_G010717 [Mnemiopsis leidyi]